ncbi:uncharacterized protein LOC135837934 [Planococcus citri]|uniref:uncharacterized protein LOC135837934 n=1 Tax=Planococcus citri TaxID=170843 RepID=UPI0031F77D21
MPSTPAKLSSWAARSLCIRLVYEWANSDDMPVNDLIWRNDKNGHDTCENHDLFIDQMYEMRVPSTIIVPHLIRDQIDENIASILDHVKDWIRYHHSKHFFHDEPSSPMNEYLLGLVWSDDNRRIDYTASARSMLTNENLTTMERFRFACTYCFVEEITKLGALVEIETTSSWSFKDEPFLVYWSKYLKNELDTVCLPESISSIDVLMLEKALKDYDLWSPIEYFFSKLDTASKFHQFNAVANHCGVKYRYELLSKLDHEEWMLVYRKSIARIMLSCAESGDFEEIRHLWRRFKDTMNSKNFAIVVRELVPLSMKNSRNFNALTPLLMEMWASAREEVKKSAIKGELMRRIGEKCADLVDDDSIGFDFQSRLEYADPLRVFRALLESCDRKQTVEFIRLNFLWLVLWQPLAELKEFFVEIQLDTECVSMLKKNWKYSYRLRLACWTLLRYGEFDEFDELVWFCWYDDSISIDIDEINTASNEAKNRAIDAEVSKCVELREKSIEMRYETATLRDRCLKLLEKKIALCEECVALYKSSVVKSASGLTALSSYLCTLDWRKLQSFLLNSVFSTDHSEVDSLMMVLFRTRFMGTNYLVRKLRRAEFDDVKEFFDTVMSKYYNVLLLKYTCCDTLFRCLFNDYDDDDDESAENLVFKPDDMRDFLSWCARDDGESLIAHFKQRHLFPNAFVGQLKGCVDENGSFKASDSMEEFLVWCFPAQTDRGEFKRYLIHRYREYKPIEEVLRQRKYRQNVLNWFFDGDTDLIETFRANELMRLAD